MTETFTPHKFTGYTEETLLVPYEDAFEVECFLQDVKHLQTKNGFAEIVFTFVPYTPQDYIRLDENMDIALTKVEQRKSGYSRKIAKPMFKSDSNLYYCSQLDLPVLNVTPDDIGELSGKEATLKVHFREDHEGDVFLWCDYVNLFDPFNGIDKQDEFVPDPAGDWDF